MLKKIFYINSTNINLIKSNLYKILEMTDNIIISNVSIFTRIYGMLILHYIIKELDKEFSEKITEIIIDVGDDHSALFTSLKLNYKNIIYNGKSYKSVID
jgi:uncharacterized protein YfbU (UPF0304 family)